MTENILAIRLSGGIGDFIQGCPFVEFLMRQAPSHFRFRIYTHYADLASLYIPDLTHERIEFRAMADLYETGEALELPYWIELDDMPRFQIRPGQKFPNWLEPFYQRWLHHMGTWGPLIATHPHRALEMTKQAVSMNLNRRTLPFHLIDEPHPGFSYPQVPRLHLRGPFITVNDGYDDHHEMPLGTRSMKQWSLESWGELVTRIKKFFHDVPNFQVIQLGGKTARVIPHTDLNLAGHKSWRDSMRYLKSAFLHIDCDGGLVHARHVMDKQSVSIVMFGPTVMEYYAYENNFNLKASACSPCFWTKKDWMAKCVIGLNEPMCMNSITPDHVMEKVIIHSGRIGLK